MNSHSEIQLFIHRLSERAHLPTRGSEQAAGLDLYAANSLTIPPHGKAMVPTDLSVEIPHGHYGRIAPRSGLGWFVCLIPTTLSKPFLGNTLLVKLLVLALKGF